MIWASDGTNQECLGPADKKRVVFARVKEAEKTCFVITKVEDASGLAEAAWKEEP